MVGDGVEGPQPPQNKVEDQDSSGIEVIEDTPERMVYRNEGSGERVMAKPWPTQEAEDEINPQPPFHADLVWEFVHDRVTKGNESMSSYEERWKKIRENRKEFEANVRDVKIYTSSGWTLAKDWGVVLIGPDGKKVSDKTFPELVDYLGITARKLLDVFPVYPEAPATASVLEVIYDAMGKEGVQRLSNILGKHTEFRYRSDYADKRQQSSLRFSADPEEKKKKWQ